MGWRERETGSTVGVRKTHFLSPCLFYQDIRCSCAADSSACVLSCGSDAFFQKACQMSRAELWEKIEAAAEDLAKNAASKHALGAAAQALDEISQVDVPGNIRESNYVQRVLSTSANARGSI